ncbi:metal-dependent hydrolase [Microbulbifer spongiae]|uniref:Metal-dependent hydrolase n=1 Tax=Microbulbifer spongiae TaxID=2944933 RepID=A0ABY9ECK9_9GAMM|nr:metal-dependent hydrolase [Microbulbifer sp. MI-G]WKD49803.1 metal-dependent hydrolase [Microbulbifer sp. MI-G]
MDTLTQVALGACIGQAAFSNKLGRKAIIVGAVCGLLPDMDFLFSIGSDDFAYMATHRGLSHSVLLLPLFALPIAWLAMKWATWRQGRASLNPASASVGQFWTWYHLCFWALITHPLLDLFTTYGTQILTPLSNERFTLDGVAIVDPVYTLPMVAAIIYGLVKSQQQKKYRVWAAGALVFSSLYLCLGIHNSWDARKHVIEQLSGEAFTPIDVRASPTMFNILLWRVVAKDSNGRYAVGFFSSVARNSVKLHYYESESGELVDKALSSEQGKILKWFSTDMLRAQVREAEKDGSPQVLLTDMRFGFAFDPAASFFGGLFEFDEKLNVSAAQMYSGDVEKLEFSDEINSIWTKIWE